VRGKVTVASQVYIGSPEKVLGLMKDSSTDKADSLTRLKVEEFGALWAAMQMDTDINTVQTSGRWRGVSGTAISP